jgi:hypothetical protein
MSRKFEEFKEFKEFKEFEEFEEFEEFTEADRLYCKRKRTGGQAALAEPAPTTVPLNSCNFLNFLNSLLGQRRSPIAWKGRFTPMKRL